MPSKCQKSAVGGREENVGERADGLQSGDMIRQLHTTLDGVEWRRVAASGGWRRWLRWLRWMLASNGVDGSGGDDGTDRFVDLDDFDGSTRRHGCESHFVAQVAGCYDNWSD